MKKAVLIAAAVAAVLVIASPGFAEVKDEMSQADMKSDISFLMNDMSGMMARIAAISKDMGPENRKQMSVVMKDLSKEMTNMSNMLGRGIIADKELKRMHVRLMKTERMLSEMEIKK